MSLIRLLAISQTVKFVLCCEEQVSQVAIVQFGGIRVYAKKACEDDYLKEKYGVVTDTTEYQTDRAR